MKTKEEIAVRIDEILRDDRLWYEPANVQVNAPLALIQVHLEAELQALCWTLGITPHHAKESFKKEATA